MKEIVNELTLRNETISTMESCTGGFIVNEITNIKGASKVLKYSAITYSDEFKIKMGVSKEVIDKYSVYSVECSIEMAKAICRFSGSTYGIGVTGELNNYGTIYICIYNSLNNTKKTITLNALENRVDSKKKICFIIEQILKDFINN